MIFYDLILTYTWQVVCCYLILSVESFIDFDDSIKLFSLAMLIKNFLFLIEFQCFLLLSRNRNEYLSSNSSSKFTQQPNWQVYIHSSIQYSTYIDSNYISRFLYSCLLSSLFFFIRSQINLTSHCIMLFLPFSLSFSYQSVYITGIRFFFF